MASLENGTKINSAELMIKLMLQLDLAFDRLFLIRGPGKSFKPDFNNFSRFT